MLIVVKVKIRIFLGFIPRNPITKAALRCQSVYPSVTKRNR